MCSSENNYSVLTFTYCSGGSDQYTAKSVFQNILDAYLKSSPPPNYDAVIKPFSQERSFHGIEAYCTAV